MGRIILFIAAVAIALSPACKGERSEQAGTPKTIETTAAAQDEAAAALEAAQEAKATAESALETAREAQAIAAARPVADDGPWWTRPMVDSVAPEPGVAQSALIEADRISVAGRITETDAERLVVAPATGEPLAVRVDRATQVALDGRAASAAELRPGNQVRLLYRLDGAQLVAERVDAVRGAPAPGAEASAPPPVAPPPVDRQP